MSDEKVFNAGDEAQVKGRKRKAEIEREREIEDLKWVMADPKGRRFVWSLIEASDVGKSPFNTNTAQMAFNAGRQVAGITLADALKEHDPKGYLLMQSEALNKEMTNV